MSDTPNLSARAPEGHLHVTMTRRGTTVARVRIDSNRQQMAQRSMVGRAPDEVAHLAGPIFSLRVQA